MTIRNVTASGNITTALQAAIDASVDGDIVNITAGTCTASTVSWSNKNIVVRGQGIGVTTVTGLTIGVTTTTKAAFRIAGMSVGAANEWQVNGFDRTTPIQGWRIDHIAFAYPSYGQNIAVHVLGLTWGLIDHCTFDNAGNAIFITSYVENSLEVTPWPPDGDPGEGGLSWALPLDLGTDKAVYIEDCTFTNATGAFFGVNDCYYGTRTVFRHNSVLNAYWQTHSCRGYERGGIAKAEIYNNTFNATDSNWQRAVHVRAGTGVVFNNTLTGYFVELQCDNQRSNGQNSSTPYGAADGTHAWDGNLGIGTQAGWPCLDQIGRGPGQAFGTQPQNSEPLYAWSNTAGGSPVAMISDGDPNVQDGRDFINSPRPGYVAFTYPHPLTASTFIASAGSYAITGSSAAFAQPHGAGAYVLTGSAAGLTVSGNTIFSTMAGGYALTGSAAAFLAPVTLPVAAGSYALTGTAAGLATKIGADTGSYSLTGSAAAFVLTAGNITLACASGSYALIGMPAVLASFTRADPGSYLLTGAVTGFAIRSPAITGFYAVTGSPAIFALTSGSMTLACTGGSYALSGADVSFPGYDPVPLPPIQPSPGGVGGRTGRPLYRRLRLKKKTILEELEELLSNLPPTTAETAPLPPRGIEALMPLSPAMSLLDSVAAPPIFASAREDGRLDALMPLRAVNISPQDGRLRPDDDEDDDEVALLLELIS